MAGQQGYGMGGYGYMQGGQGGYDQYQQQAYYQQQQQMGYMQQQGYGGQQWGGYGGQQQQQQQQQQQYGGYGGQPQMSQQQQMYAQQQAAQISGGGKSSGGKGSQGQGGKDYVREMMGGGKNSGGRGGGGGGGGGGRGDKGDGRLTLEEHKAAEAERKARKEAERKEAQEAAKRAARERMLAAERGELPEAEPTNSTSGSISEKVQVLQRGDDAPKKEEAKKEAPPAKTESEPVADDWDAEEESPPPPVEEKKEEPPPAPEPVKEPEKKAPEKKAEPPPEPVKPKKVVEAPQEPPPAAEEEEEEEDEVVEEGGAVKEGEAKEPDPRPHLNVVFIGHVDAGKSTTCGNILFLSGCVDERSVEKYMKEAKDKNRESWFLAYIMDTNEEEKAKGKTVEVGRAHFETPNRRFTILDAPGHKSYVPNMISGASQADVGVLIISARKGEFETGFERGGQTGEHALLAKTLGVEKLLICINKMDDDSVEWAQERYDEIVNKLSVFLEKTAQFKKDQIIFLPISGLKGHNIKERLSTPAWFTGKTLLDTLDSTDLARPSKDAALRIPLLEGYRDMGAIMAIGKVEQGTVKPGMKCVVMPIGAKCTVQVVNINDEPMKFAKTGENVTLKMSGVTEEQLAKGYVMCPVVEPIRVVSKFKAMMQVIELPEERPVMTAGYKAILHCHVASEECEIAKLQEACSMNNLKKKEKNPKFVRENSVLWCTITLARPTALDAFTGTAQLGRFTIRDEGRTVAIGKILELPKEK